MILIKKTKTKEVNLKCMQNRVAILAGNYEQFIKFMSQPVMGNDQTEYFYIERPEKAYGCKFDDYKIVGTFWKREDAGKLEEVVKSRLI